MGSFRSSPAPTPPQLQSPLIRLPAELRNKIYLHTLVEDRPIGPFLQHRKKPRKHPPHPRATLSRRSRHVAHTYRRLPGILQTCNQTRKEALPVYYGNNVFHLHPRSIYKDVEDHHHAALMSWLISHPAAAKYVHHIVLFDLPTPRIPITGQGSLELQSLEQDADERVVVNFSESWGECTCQVEMKLRKKADTEAKALGSSEGDVGVMACAFVEEMMMNLQNPMELAWPWPEFCDDCGLYVVAWG